MAEETKVVEGSKEEAVVTTGNEPQPISDDAIVEYVVRGETVRKPWKEAKSGFMMQEDYTRSKQELSARAKDVESIHGKLSEREKGISAKEAELDERRRLVDQVLGGKSGDTSKKVQLADDDVITAAQARELMKQDREELQRQFDEKLGKTSSQLQQDRQFERWEDLTTKTISALQAENPILKRLPSLDVVLKREAMKDKPQSEQELVDAYVKAGKNLVKELDSEFDTRVKEAAIKKTKTQQTAPDRVQGQPVFTTTKDYTKNHGRSVDWNKLESDVIAAIESQEE